MSCEIIQFSAAARPARPVSDKRAPPGVLTPMQRRREGKPRASTAGDRNRQKFPNPDRAPRCMVACRAGGRLLARAL
jgi:hypothetical protein